MKIKDFARKCALTGIMVTGISLASTMAYGFYSLCQDSINQQQLFQPFRNVGLTYVCNRVLEEGDLNQDGNLSQSELEYALNKDKVTEAHKLYLANQ